MKRTVIMKNLKTLHRVKAYEDEEGVVTDKNGNPLDRFWVPANQSPGFLGFFVAILIIGLFAYWGARLI